MQWDKLQGKGGGYNKFHTIPLLRSWVPMKNFTRHPTPPSKSKSRFDSQPHAHGTTLSNEAQLIYLPNNGCNDHLPMLTETVSNPSHHQPSIFHVAIFSVGFKGSQLTKTLKQMGVILEGQVVSTARPHLDALLEKMFHTLPGKICTVGSCGMQQWHTSPLGMWISLMFLRMNLTRSKYSKFFVIIYIMIQNDKHLKRNLLSASRSRRVGMRFGWSVPTAIQIGDIVNLSWALGSAVNFNSVLAQFTLQKAYYNHPHPHATGYLV